MGGGVWVEAGKNIDKNVGDLMVVLVCCWLQLLSKQQQQ